MQQKVQMPPVYLSKLSWVPREELLTRHLGINRCNIHRLQSKLFPCLCPYRHSPFIHTLCPPGKVTDPCPEQNTSCFFFLRWKGIGFVYKYRSIKRESRVFKHRYFNQDICTHFPSWCNISWTFTMFLAQFSQPFKAAPPVGTGWEPSGHTTKTVKDIALFKNTF